MQDPVTNYFDLEPYRDSRHDKSLSDPDVSPGRSRSQSRLVSVETDEGEVDSGIAVIEQVTSSQVNKGFMDFWVIFLYQ